LLRETHHRCSNDLQLIVGLLELQSRRANSPEVRAALADATGRVAVLARARAEMNRERQPNLQSALRQVCEALHSQAEPRSILITMEVAYGPQGLTSEKISTLALAVIELATNAIKHAFEEGKDGHVSILVHRSGEREAVIIVDDDGLPFPEPSDAEDAGMGLGLIKRLIASIDCLFIQPVNGSKRFEIRIPHEPN
jgi:two-component sensor histidine kinase